MNYRGIIAIENGERGGHSVRSRDAGLRSAMSLVGALRGFPNVQVRAHYPELTEDDIRARPEIY